MCDAYSPLPLHYQSVLYYLYIYLYLRWFGMIRFLCEPLSAWRASAVKGILPQRDAEVRKDGRYSTLVRALAGYVLYHA